MTVPYHFEADDGAFGSWQWSETVVSGSVALVNEGTAPSPVLIRIDGPVINPQILHVGSGQIMAFDMSLGVGHYAIMNGMTHEILIDGTDPARGRVVRREWSQAEVGSNSWSFSADEYSATARMMVSFYPAYM